MTHASSAALSSAGEASGSLSFGAGGATSGSALPNEPNSPPPLLGPLPEVTAEGVENAVVAAVALV